MRHYTGLVLGIGILAGAVAGYQAREVFPPGTKYVQYYFFKKETEFTKKATGIAGGCTVGFIGGLTASLVIEHFLRKRKNKNGIGL